MSYQHPTPFADQSLLERIASRDASALSELYDRFSKLLYGVILAVVRDTDDAEDVLQEVFVQIWKSAATYQPALGSPKTWLAKLAHNRAIDLLRSKRYQQRKMEVKREDDEELPVAPGTFAENTTWSQTVNRERSVHLSAALTHLPPEQRSLIDLAFFQGLTHHEIAESTGIPLGTVKTRIRTGMHALRNRLHFMAADEV